MTTICGWSRISCPSCNGQRYAPQSHNPNGPVVVFLTWLDGPRVQNAVEDESLVRTCGYPRELGSREVAAQDVEYRHIERAAPYYKQFLHPQGE
jgi:hypothetical protein